MKEAPSFYGHVDSIEEMGASRIAVQIDAIAAKVFDDDAHRPASEEGLGFLRVVSTSAVLKDLIGDGENLAVGDWVELGITPNIAEPGPRVWSLQLRDNQFIGDETGRPARGKLVLLRRLSSGSRSTGPQELGAAVPALLSKGNKLRARYSLLNISQPISPAQANAFFRRWGRTWGGSQPIALDVGQASFNIICPKSKPGPPLYFDVGQPIWFHLHSVPANFSPPVTNGGFVILSHWDTDHYAYGRQNSSFHKKTWFAPAQKSVGPNANVFATQLHNLGRLYLVGAGRSSRHRRGARVIQCSGDTMNGSGLALHLRSCGRDILFTGDADYHEIPTMQGIRLSGLQLPHHGGKSASLAVIPTAMASPSRAVISCGLPNRYGHPNSTTISDHKAAKWNVDITAGGPGSPRGPRLL